MVGVCPCLGFSSTSEHFAFTIQHRNLVSFENKISRLATLKDGLQKQKHRQQRYQLHSTKTSKIGKAFEDGSLVFLFLENTL
mmetsp:Transcript_16585/g.20115  ORF Transcript_16585/g.20115 Transcript_16585/m.20115 type:complete len:82 (-) Transcript_16585:227-472(-)